MGLGDFFKDVGDTAAHGIRSTVNALNNLDPFHDIHYDPSSPGAPTKTDRPLAAPIGNPINHQVENVSRVLSWVYDNGISQPLSTALMVGELPGGAGAPFSTHNWSQAWHAAEHISPGQALFLGNDETKKAVDSPLSYYKPGDAYLPPDFKTWSADEQQTFLKNAGMPAIGNKYIEELRQSSTFFKYASGTGDFAMRWWADPAILAGKGASAARRELQVVKAPPTGWSSADIDKIMNKSVMVKAQDFVFANRGNPALLNNLAMAQHSALGPRFGAIASLLKTPDEVQDFFRVTMGDVDAIERLTMKNELAGARLAQDSDRISQLDLMRTRYANNPHIQNMVDQQMDALNTRINADTDMVHSYNNVLDHAHETDQINLSRWAFARAEQKTAAQEQYRAAAARGAKAGALGRRVTVTPTPFLSRGTATPVDLGLKKTMLFGVGDFFSTPLTVVRSFANARPNGYMRVDDVDNASIAELRGHIARIPGIDNSARLKMLNDYIKTKTEQERIDLLDEVGHIGAAKIAEKHGLDPKMGLELYQKHLSDKFGEVDKMKRYSAAVKPIQLEDGSFARVRVDEFAMDGGKLVVHPNLVSRLSNDHVLQDLGEMDKVLARHGSALSALRTARLGNTDWMTDGADYLTQMFKFGTLFRLGYIPRVASDDLAGQWARLGSAAMAMRFGWGVRNGATNAALYLQRPYAIARAESAEAGVKYAKEKMAEVEKDMLPLRQQVQGRRAGYRTDLRLAGRRLAAAKTRRAAMDPATTPPARIAAMDKLIAQHETAVQRASRSMSTGVAARNLRLRDLEAHYGFLDHYRGLQAKAAADAYAEHATPKAIQGSRPVNLGNGVQAPGAFQGPQGEYYMKHVSGDEALGQIFNTNKQIIHGHLMRSFDHGGKSVSAAQAEDLHAVSWAHAINNQMMQDELSVRAIQGESVADMTKWLTATPAGRIYRRRLGLVMTDPEEFANAAFHEASQYLPLPEIRQKAFETGGVTPQFLKDAVPMAQRPEVHTGQIGKTQKKYLRALDEMQQRWFHMAAEIPANRLSRHPLFNQLYEGHLRRIQGTLTKQGAFDTTVNGVNDMATHARRLALRDTRKLVFDIAHRSDASAAMRFIAPFMTATNESFQRWGRIIADKPQVVGYAANFYNAPAAMGGVGVGGLHFNGMQDSDGNQIDRHGNSYVIDPKTGKAVKQQVPKSQRYIVGRMPAWLVDSQLGTVLGVDRSTGNFKLSQNSMNLVTQGDPWFSPGFGPIVQIPVNELVKDKPKDAVLARQLDILPFGPQQGTGLFGDNAPGRAVNFLAPATIKNFLTAYDTSDERYQAVKLQIVQKAAFEHETLGKPMPSAQQIADMTKNYWRFSALSAFLQPMATQKVDKYQFYRDQYNALRRQDPLRADQNFLDRFGESYFIFAQSQSKNEAGIPSTAKAVELSKKYASLIEANPELGALIVGPEGNGPFSAEAYSYQLNSPLSPGGSEMQRTKISADAALKENQRRLGWAKYTTMINNLTAQLHNRGLKSFTDKGAEDLRQTKSNYTKLYAQPLYPDGSPNPFYNAEWSKDYSTLDPLKYDRLIPSLQEVSRSPLANQPDRSDLRTLQTYLGGRQELLRQLAARGAAGGAKTITAKANADLADRWGKFVDNLIETDTRFGDLHSRYLARDLGYDGSDLEST